MKRLFAIILMIFMLTACAAEKPQPQEEAPAAETEVTEEIVREAPAEEEPEEPSYAEEEMPYESIMVDGGVEDTVGFGFEIPQFDCPGSEKIREFFDWTVQNMEDYTKEVVYENAMSRGCIVSVYGRVDSATVADNILTVHYSYECQYSDAEEPEVESTVMRFDMTTGEPVE